jgi:hypothetical protein
MCILMRGQGFDLRYTHRIVEHGHERAFEFDTSHIKRELDDLPLSYPAVREWLNEFIAQGEAQLKER